MGGRRGEEVWKRVRREMRVRGRGHCITCTHTHMYSNSLQNRGLEIIGGGMNHEMKQPRENDRLKAYQCSHLQ